MLWKLKDGSFEESTHFSMPHIPFQASGSLYSSTEIPPTGLSCANSPEPNSHRDNLPQNRGMLPSLAGGKEEDYLDPRFPSAHPFKAHPAVNTFVHLLYTVVLNDGEETKYQFSFIIDILRTFLNDNWAKNGYSSKTPVPYDVWSCPPTEEGIGAAVPQDRAVAVFQESVVGPGTICDLGAGRYARIVHGDPTPAGSAARSDPKRRSSIEVFDLLLPRGYDPLSSSRYRTTDSSYIPPFDSPTCQPTPSPRAGSLVRSDWVERPSGAKDDFVIKECSCGTRRAVRLSHSERPDDTDDQQESEDSFSVNTVDRGDSAGDGHEEVDLDIECGFTGSLHWDDFNHRGRLVRQAKKDLEVSVVSDWGTRLMLDDGRIIPLRVSGLAILLHSRSSSICMRPYSVETSKGAIHHRFCYVMTRHSSRCYPPTILTHFRRLSIDNRLVDFGTPQTSWRHIALGLCQMPTDFSCTLSSPKPEIEEL